MKNLTLKLGANSRVGLLISLIGSTLPEEEEFFREKKKKINAFEAKFKILFFSLIIFEATGLLF